MYISRLTKSERKKILNNDNKDLNNGDLTPEKMEETLTESVIPQKTSEEPKTDVSSENSASPITPTESAVSVTSDNEKSFESLSENTASENGNVGTSGHINGGTGSFNGNFYNQRKPEPNAAEVLNSYLFGLDTPSMIKPPKKDSAALKKVWKTVGVLLLTIAVSFSGAFACFYWVCNTALLGDSDFFRTLMVQASGIEINKVEVDMISGNYEEDTVALAEKIKQHTISVYVYDETGRKLGYASGVIVSSNGLAVTNYHVVYGNEKTLKAALYDGTVCEISVLHLDKLTDLAVIKIETDKTLIPVTWADSTKAKAGQSIAICGNPLGLEFSVSFGKIAHPDRNLGDVAGNSLQLDASANPGNSGCGVYDAMGNLLGIVDSKASGNNVDGIGYAIPSARVLDVMNQLLKNGFVGGRPAIGFTLVQVNQSTWDYFKNGDGTNPGELNDYLYEAKYGIYIIESKYNSEIKKGDRIVSCNGVEFDDRDSFSQWLMKYKPGDTVRVTVERITNVTENADGSYTVQRERNTYECTLRERDWADEPYAK